MRAFLLGAPIIMYALTYTLGLISTTYVSKSNVFSGDYTDLFLTLSDDVDDVIQTKHILITDVSQSSGDTLICWSTRTQGSFSWFHQFIGSEELTELPRVTENKPSYFGWKIKIVHKSGYNMLTLLNREMDTIPIEGIFTCRVGSSGDLGNSEAVSVGIHYPSKFFLSFFSYTHHEQLFANLRNYLACLCFDDLNQRSVSIMS